MAEYSAYLTRVGILVKDKDKNLDAGTREEVIAALNQAAKRYSRHKKPKKVVAVTADGGRLYALPTGWVTGVSDDFVVEYPVDDTAEQVQYLDRSMCELYQTPDATKLRFRTTQSTNWLPADDEVFRVHFSILFELTATSVTVPDVDFDAVCKLAASELCLILAVRYGQLANSVGGGDIADFRDKQTKFTDLAREFYKQYAEEILPKEEDLVGAFAFGEFIETPLHSELVPTYPRDTDGRLLYDRS